MLNFEKIVGPKKSPELKHVLSLRLFVYFPFLLWPIYTRTYSHYVPNVSPGEIQISFTLLLHYVTVLDFARVKFCGLPYFFIRQFF